MPGFPDKFAPFYKTPPGAAVSSLIMITRTGDHDPLERMITIHRIG